MDIPRPEFPATLDVEALLGGGWRPLPFHQFILKIYSRCDLHCDWCYVYEHADQSWRSQPRRMSDAIVDRTAARIAEHAKAHDLPEVTVVLHGGEPLLAGADMIARTVRTIRAAVERPVKAVVQTNGVRLDETFLDVFAELDIHVGVSLDGDQVANDRHRLFADGRSSYPQVENALRLLGKDAYRHLFNGILCTIDVRNPAIATYEALLEFDPPTVDFLLPHGNWSSPPPFRIPNEAGVPYADFLIPIFDRFYRTERKRTDVRLFTEIIRLLVGGKSHTESIGLSPVLMAVVETNGAIQQSDILKSSYPGAPATPLHVLTDPFDAALTEPAIIARQLGAGALAPECRGCEVMSVCGGGLYAHRYDEQSGFMNRSVYCPDLLALIRHIHRTLEADLAAVRSRKSDS
ncbi:FxsB family cyclophane-forming radical SAM/SPASM peptide maturase [Herbidospora daliensis]|uniref:FxsB family cyclophane-forming radical SAM/SPASM peptide maturase n=1 Tax=Herbidospora daliensis TaxID=295585 RepID=UPI00078362C7|nr:FxsB family cyclophane-forming radical SAM/SPASM peptide maturase [Herbidospora daliensis]